MIPYATEERFVALLPSGDMEGMKSADVIQHLERASEDIDALTYCRIPAKGGLEALTPAQQEIVSSVTAQLAVWRHRYMEAVESPFSSYSINGVSMSMEPKNVITVEGVTVPRRIYALLCNTGLCYRGLA